MSKPLVSDKSTAFGWKALDPDCGRGPKAKVDEIQKLRDGILSLTKWLRHHSDCDALTHEPCSCGLNAELARLGCKK